jgi:hypothetical protein
MVFASTCALHSQHIRMNQWQVPLPFRGQFFVRNAVIYVALCARPGIGCSVFGQQNRRTVNDCQPQEMLMIARTIPVFRSGEEKP